MHSNSPTVNVTFFLSDGNKHKLRVSDAMDELIYNLVTL